MLQRQVPERVSGASGKRFVAFCLMAVTLCLLAVPDGADLQPAMVAGLQSFNDNGDDADDGGDVNGKHITMQAVFGALLSDRMVANRHVDENAAFGDGIEVWKSRSPRGPPPVWTKQELTFSTSSDWAISETLPPTRDRTLLQTQGVEWLLAPTLGDILRGGA